MRTLNFKILVSLVQIVLLTNGCMTYTSVQKARGKPYYNFNLLGVTPSEPKPAYYAIVPVTVPLDVITCPFQGIWFGCQCLTIEGLGTTP